MYIWSRSDSGISSTAVILNSLSLQLLPSPGQDPDEGLYSLKIQNRSSIHGDIEDPVRWSLWTPFWRKSDFWPFFIKIGFNTSVNNFISSSPARPQVFRWIVIFPRLQRQCLHGFQDVFKMCYEIMQMLLNHQFLINFFKILSRTFKTIAYRKDIGISRFYCFENPSSNFEEVN